MRVLVVSAHPKASSLTQALARAFIRGLGEAGHAADSLDLYAAGIDPVVQAGELDPGPRPAAVRRDQDRLGAAQGLALIYPVWWGTPPAMLQGWLQRIMTYGFAFDTVGGRPRGLLGHRTQLIANVGGPESGQGGGQGDLYLEPLRTALRFCGMGDIRSQVNFGIGRDTAPAVIEAALAQAYQAGRGF